MDKITYKILKTAYKKHRIISDMEIHKILKGSISETVDYLEQTDYLVLLDQVGNDRFFALTLSGTSYVEQRRKNTIIQAVTLLLSAVAIIISIIALLK